jgi:DNA-binding winged helix-turn-helix (wHTH) protein/Tfp pilus assembly protein PilF
VTSSGRERLLRFSVFEIDLEARELRRRGRLLPLPPQPFAVLAELAARSGRVVSREELRALLWGDGVHVNHERGLNHCLNRIRRVLGDDARSPRFVETVPRQGYRFLASVQAVEPEADAQLPPARPSGEGRALSWLACLGALLLALQSPEAGRRPRSGPSGRPSANRAAQTAFVEGSRLMEQGPAGWRRSVEYFSEAARRDAGFALARYSLADAYLRLGEQGALPAHQAFPAARRAALAALAIEDNAETLVILAALDLNYEWDWAAAEDAYRRALRLDPDLTGARVGYARLLSAAGRHAEALRLVGEAESRHPGCPEIVRDAGLTLYRARRFDEAARRFHDWADLEPGLRDPHHWLALLHYLRGQDERALREVRIVMALAQAPPAFVARFNALPPRAAMEFYLRGCIQYLEGLTSAQWVTADDFARLRALLGERDHALRDLERAADERSPRLLPYLNDPAFDTLRSEARFLALRRRVRLPAADPVPARLLAVAAAPVS